MTAIKEEDLNNPAIYQYLYKLVGDEGMELIQRCPEEEHSDEEIAEITGINLNSVRHTLYSLYEHRLAEYRRITNRETGWLTYLWVLKMENIPSVLEGEMQTVVEKLSARLRYDENNDFYPCGNCGLMMTFKEAMSLNFSCPQCGDMLVHFDDELLVSALRNRIEKMKAALAEE